MVVGGVEGRSPARLSRRARQVVTCIAWGCLLGLAGPADGQGTGPVWVALDTQPAGTPASVILIQDLSSTEETIFDVTLSGFYVTSRLGPDGLTYQDIQIPGLPTTSAPGEPRLPVVRVDLGIVTGAPEATLVEATPLDLRALPGYLVWPSPAPAELHDGAPSQFVRDSLTYASTVDWPAGDGIGGPTRSTLGGVPASLCTVYPIHWNPASGTLTVAAHARYRFHHPGGLGTPMSFTRDRADLASSALLNWDVIGSSIAIDWNRFDGCYLFVCPAPWLSTLQPLVQEKKTRGFSVTVIGVPMGGFTCGQLKQTIQNWYAGTPSGYDHYALLVGPAFFAPFCTDMYGQLSDKVLSSVNGDGEPEIFLGRVTVGTQGELQTQVKKILDYETGSQVNQDGNVLLVAHHQQDQDFDFASYQEAVRTAVYAQVTPSFITCYGTNPSLGNSDIKNPIESGVGVVAYIGHGDPDRWLHWSYAGASYASSDAGALTNGALTPVIWSIACQTADPRSGSSLASGFMKNPQGGAVAFYGAVDQTYGSIVTVLEDTLFQAVYGRGITRHGPAIALAEHATVVADPLFGFDAVYKYLLYGDPDMEVKRHSPGGPWLPIDLGVPPYLLAPCPGAGCCPSCLEPVVDIQVRDAAGAPLPDAKVALWKPNWSGNDEVLDNRYSGPDGWVHIPAPGLTAGTLYVGFDDGDGRAGLDSIDVQPQPSGVGPGGAPQAHLVAAPSITDRGTRLRFGRALDAPARLHIYSPDGRLVRAWNVPTGAAFLEWDGRDRMGRLVGAGIYLARLDLGARRMRTRIVVLR